MARLWGVRDQPYSHITGAVADNSGANPGPAIEKTKKRKYNHTSQSNPVSCSPLQSALCRGPGRGASLNRHYGVTIHSILHVKIFNPTGSNCVTTAVYVQHL